MAGFVGALVIFLVVTLVAVHVQSDCGIAGVFGVAGCADDIRRVGFSWVVWEEGGFEYRNVFDPVALLLDVDVGLSSASLEVSWRSGRRDEAACGRDGKMRRRGA